MISHPFNPRFSIPETFGDALSYEGQIHWLADMYSHLLAIGTNWEQVENFLNNYVISAEINENGYLVITYGVNDE